MGWLHDGHRALMRQARAADATTVVTIFVNPRQFNVAADFTQVPAQRGARPRDLRVRGRRPRLRAAGRRRSIRRASTRSCRSARSPRPLEGAARPGHFDGVATVVAILFDLVGAERAYFGQKDAQQVMVIRQMARDLAIATEVIACPTVREPDGLALSSRNVHLVPGEQRAAAPVLRRALARGARRAGRPASGRARRCETRCGEPRRRAAGRRRVRLRRGRDDARGARPGRRTARSLSLAVRFGTTRLIDNEPLGDPPAADLTAGMAAGRRIVLAYLVYFAAIGAAFPYLPVFYRDLGLDLDEIGVLTAVQAAIQLVLGPGLGRAGGPLPADPRDAAARGRRRHGRRVDPVSGGRASGHVSSGSLILFGGLAGIGPTLDARTLETLGPAKPRPVRQVRAFGSLAFVAVDPAGRLLLDAAGARSLFWAYLPVLVVTALVTATIPDAAARRVRSACGAARASSSRPRDPAVLRRLHRRLDVARRDQRVLLDPDRRARRQPALVGITWAIGASSRSRTCTRSRASPAASAPSGSSSSGRSPSCCAPCWRRSPSTRSRSC